MDMISAISTLGTLSPYSITSINGNPNSLDPIGKIGEKESKKNKALVIATENRADLYVKDFGDLPKPTRLESGAFAEALSMQEKAAEQITPAHQNNGQTVAFYNDTIGMMGYSNMMRNQLTGSGFTPFQ